MQHDTAGDPMTGIKWSRRTTRKIAEQLATLGIAVSKNTVGRLLKQLRYKLRVNRKQIASSKSPLRNQQFLYIGDQRQRFVTQGLPVISVDSKKKELIGNFKNPGAKWDRQPQPVKDHDFRSEAKALATPRGIYDLQANRGSVFVGVSHDTPDLPSIRLLNGGSTKADCAIRKRTRFLSWRMGAEVTARVAAPGKRLCKIGFAIPWASPSR
jgi:hypothetical protein